MADFNNTTTKSEEVKYENTPFRYNLITEPMSCFTTVGVKQYFDTEPHVDMRVGDQLLVQETYWKRLMLAILIKTIVNTIKFYFTAHFLLHVTKSHS